MAGKCHKPQVTTIAPARDTNTVKVDDGNTAAFGTKARFDEPAKPLNLVLKLCNTERTPKGTLKCDAALGAATIIYLDNGATKM